MSYIFFRVYTFISVINKSIPEISAVVIMSGIMSFNLLSIFLLISRATGSHLSKIYFQVPFFCFLILNWFFFLRRNKDKYIIEKNKNTKVKFTLFHDILILSYVCASFYLLFFLIDLDTVYTKIFILMILGSSLFVFLVNLFLKNEK